MFSQNLSAARQKVGFILNQYVNWVQAQPAVNWVQAQPALLKKVDENFIFAETGC